MSKLSYRAPALDKGLDIVELFSDSSSIPLKDEVNKKIDKGELSGAIVLEKKTKDLNTSFLHRQKPYKHL